MDDVVIDQVDLTVVVGTDYLDVSWIEEIVPLAEGLVPFRLDLIRVLGIGSNEHSLAPSMVTGSRFHSPMTTRLSTTHLFSFEVDDRHLTFGSCAY